MLELLRDVSRSFYLTLRVLPGQIRPQIGLAYLLARTTDTIADTRAVQLELRQQALHDLARRILGQTNQPLHWGQLARNQATPAERILLERVEETLALLQTLTPADLSRVRLVLQTIVSGQSLDLQRFNNASRQNVIALQIDADLDDYTYRVAGCVGEFWTHMCRAHLFPSAPIDETQLLRNGVRFGQGLQLVNILRDLPEDLRQGRCYIPERELAAAGLKPPDLLNPQNEPRFRPLYHRLLDRAEANLRAGWTYTNSLPSGQVRVRLACAWPILIGMKTLSRLRIGNVLEPRRIKVSRQEVYQLILKSLVLYPIPPLWRNQINQRAPQSQINNTQPSILN